MDLKENWRAWKRRLEDGSDVSQVEGMGKWFEVVEVGIGRGDALREISGGFFVFGLLLGEESG